MIKYMYYNGTNNEVKKGTNLDYKLPSKNDFIWLFMQNPAEGEIKKVCRDFSIENKYFRTFSKEHRSVRYLMNPLIFVFMDYYLEANKIKSSRILFILKENALIIVMQRKNTFHNELFDKLVDSFEQLEKKSLLRLMYQFLMDDVEENYEVVERVESIIMDLEKDIVSGKNGKRVQDIIKFKRAIYQMSRRFWGSAKIVFVIKKGLTPLKVDVESVLLLDDVYNTYMHQIDILSTAKEMLTDILSIYDSRMQNELNLVIKKLTSITVIIMVPTLIASIYGMNFHHIPELDWQLGFPLAILLMFISIFASMVFFKRKKWL
jgi:magnesium transporter